MAYDNHPISDLFPSMSPEEYTQLCVDIGKHGLQKKIVLFQGKILDGRHRERACVETKTPAKYETYKGKDAVAFAISANLRRRNLDTSQRAMCAAKLKTYFEEAAQERMKGGKGTDPMANLPQGTSRDQAGAQMGVSGKSVDAASKVLEGCIKPIIKAVEVGNVSVSDAKTVAELPKDEQRQALKAVLAGEAKTLSEAIKKSKEITDSEGHVVTGKSEPAFRTLDKFNEMDSLCRKLQALIDEVSKGPGGEQLKRFLKAVGSEEKTINKSEHLDALKRNLKGVRPHSVCPFCQGAGAAKCKGCGGAAWVTKVTWEGAEENVRARI